MQGKLIQNIYTGEDMKRLQLLGKTQQNHLQLLDSSIDCNAAPTHPNPSDIKVITLPEANLITLRKMENLQD